MDANKLISAKDVFDNYKIDQEEFLDLIHKEKITVYDKTNNPITLKQYKDIIQDLIFDNIPIDFSLPLEDRARKNLDYFDFGTSDIDSIVASQMVAEEKRASDAIFNIEIKYVMDNYRFKAIEIAGIFVDSVKYQLFKGDDNKYIIIANANLWEGLTPDIACKNMRNVGMEDHIITYVLSKKKNGEYNQETIGKAVSGVSKSPDAHKKEVGRLLKKFDSLCHPF